MTGEKGRDLREAQEKCRSPNEEGCRCGYRYIATGTKAARRGGVSESPTHTETRRHRGENTERIGGVKKQAFDVRLLSYGRKVLSYCPTFIVPSGKK